MTALAETSLTDPSLVGGGMALAAAAMWSISTTLFKGAVVHFGPRAMNLFRCTIALVLFWATTLVVKGDSVFHVLPTHAGFMLLGSGVLGLAVGDHFLFHAMKKLGAHSAIAMNQLSPVWSALLGLLLGVEVLRGWQYPAIGLVILGVTLVIFSRVEPVHVDALARSAAGRQRWLGIGAGFISSFCNASAALMTKQVIAGVGALQSSTLRMTGSVVFLVGGSLLTRRLVDDSIALRTLRHRQREIVAVFIASFIAILLQQAAFERSDASVALCLLSTTPIFLLPLAVGILHEHYRWTAVLGTLLAMAGIPLLVFGGAR